MRDANDCFEICGPAAGQPLAPELPQGPAPAGRERCRAGLGAGEAARRLGPQRHEHAGAAGGGAAGGRRTARRGAAHGEGRARSGPGAAPAPAAGDVPRPRAGAGLERGARGRRGAGAPRERSRDRRARPPDGPSHGGSARAPDPRPARAGRSALAGAAFRAARGLARPRARGPRRRRPRAARALEEERARPRRPSAHARVPPRGGRVHAGDRRPQGGERPGRAGRRDDRAPARGQVVTLQPRPIQELQRSVRVPRGRGWLRRMLAFAGPAYLVSVGYMDPGNWGTDLQGGAKFGYQLVWVLVMSNAMAILLQTLSARLGVVTGRDLAQACRDFYPRFTLLPQWLLCELAIVACDLAEVLGAAIGLQLLFHIPLLVGVMITAFDVLLLLALTGQGVRRLEAF